MGQPIACLCPVALMVDHHDCVPAIDDDLQEVLPDFPSLTTEGAPEEPENSPKFFQDDNLALRFANLGIVRLGHGGEVGRDLCVASREPQWSNGRVWNGA